MLIATHDGSFHADETIACAILTYLFENAQIIRTRDPKLLETADLIIDVSGINDHKHFDHHSPQFNEKRDNGINYATAGLMWKLWGIKYLKKAASDFDLKVDDKILEGAQKRIDVEMMEQIDLNDNGQLNSYLNARFNPTAEQKSIFDDLNAFYQNDPSIPYLVAMQNLPNVKNEQQTKLFLNTVKCFKTLLCNAAVNALYTQLGIEKVRNCYQGGKLLIMHERLPWTAAIFDDADYFKDCLLCIYPDRKNGWRVQSLPYSRAERFKNRINAPHEWRGLNFVELDRATGLTGTIFVHRGGFTGGAYDYETTLQMAKMWLEQGECLSS